jgi:hypothetical protein
MGPAPVSPGCPERLLEVGSTAYRAISIPAELDARPSVEKPACYGQSRSAQRTALLSKPRDRRLIDVPHRQLTAGG